MIFSNSVAFVKQKRFTLFLSHERILFIEEPLNQTTDNKAVTKSDLTVPLAILVAGLLISISVIVFGKSNQNPGNLSSGNQGKDLGSQSNNLTPTNPPPGNSGSVQNVKAVNQSDHVLGSSDAPVKVIEFSDLECPFCKSFHPTMKKIAAEYPGKVAWIYRHFPLDSIHPKARKEAEAAECANEQGGNDKFWAYVDRIFEITPSNNGLDPQKLPQLALDIGLDSQKFQTCLDSGKYAGRVASDLADAKSSGGRGTPYSIVMAKDGRKTPVNGAVPYEELKTVIEEALR